MIEIWLTSSSSPRSAWEDGSFDVVIKAFEGYWALAPFTLASEDKVRNQANQVALGRPGAGEELPSGYGFVDVRRFDVPFAREFPDPAAYARALPLRATINVVGYLAEKPR